MGDSVLSHADYTRDRQHSKSGCTFQRPKEFLSLQFGGLESIITGLCDEFPNLFGRHRSLFVLGVLVICYLGALPTCTYGGDYIVNLMNEIAVAPALLLVVFVECIAVSWFYGKRQGLNITRTRRRLHRRKSIFQRYQSNDWFTTLSLLACHLVSDQSNVLIGKLRHRREDLRHLLL